MPAQKKQLSNKRRVQKLRTGSFDRDFEARLIGNTIRSLIGLNAKLPSLKYSYKMNSRVLRRIVIKQEIKDDKAINRIYRAAHKGQDELFSTSFTREFIKGLFESKGIGPPDSSEMRYLEEMVDMASSARIATEHSGFATKDAIMQHPANRDKALFADPYDTASLHSKMDTERRDYVEFSMRKAIDDGAKDAKTVMIEGVKASIEFTLNYFTAPITAHDVHPFSKSKNKQVTDKALQDQLISREKMKIRYVELGGQLRKLESSENQMESIARGWSMGRPEEGGAYIAPPSPRRSPITLKSDVELMVL